MATTPVTTDIAVLREMVRLAEKRRDEELHMMERVNQYNLGLVAFGTGLISFLVANEFSKEIVAITGLFCILSILLSLLAISPRRLKGTIVIGDDANAIRDGEILELFEFLLCTAELAEQTGNNVSNLVQKKKSITIFSATFLACGIIGTYIMYVCQR